MARFVPDVKPDDFNNSYGERKVYEALRALDDRHTVFYSLSWVGSGGHRTVGEADFVVAHPQKGVLVIEVKSGGIAYREGAWIQTNTATGYEKHIDPFAQARKSQFELLDRLRDASLGFRLPMMCYCAWFPTVEMPSSALPPEAAPEITLDMRSLEDPSSALDACFGYWEAKYGAASLDRYQFQRVIDVLCPHFNIIPKLKVRAEEAEESYIRLTAQQVSLLDFLEEQRTAVIHGLAGTGKTVLAVEKAKRLASQGRQVLFLCYNSLLRDTLKGANSVPGVTFHNAHSLARSMHPMPDTPIEEVLVVFEESELEKLVSSFVERAIAEGLAAEDVVVLTCGTPESSWLETGHLYGGMSLSLEREPGKVFFTTIRKFKGLEAEAVLIVDSSLSSLTSLESRRLLYVGSSRAKTLLGIAMLEDVDRQDFGDLLHAIAPDRNVPRNKKGLKRLFQMADSR